MSTGKMEAKQRSSTSPRYYDLVVEAILMLKDRRGSNRDSIADKVKIRKKTDYKRHYVLKALRTGVANGTIIHKKGRFQLSPDEKNKVIKGKRYSSSTGVNASGTNSVRKKEKTVVPVAVINPSTIAPVVNGLDELDTEAKRWGELYHFY